ncbi:MAG: hypothetical protein Q9185_002573 [Variospora sp. 1 TL-2023]
MRRKLSSSADEDNDENPLDAAKLTHDEKKTTFTTAKYDWNRHSDTLDRRKAEKVWLPALSAARTWTSPTRIQASTKRQEVVSPHLAGEKMLDARGRLQRQTRSPWSCSLFTGAATVAAIFLMLFILHSFVTRQLDSKGCDMYYTRSKFFNFADFDTEHTRFASKYSLHLYREIGYDEDPKDQVKGVPVLFIPGNAGSYRQARSLASETVQHYYNTVQQDKEALKGGATSIDFFSVDFNEDFTAFHGQTLLDQAEYLNDAVAYILSLYHDPRRSQRDSGLPDPSSVILIGHSMGGVAARTMLTMPNYQSNSINTIITISAPHARSPVSVDADLVRTYQRVNTYWRDAYSQKWASDNPLWHVTLISIAGGSLDTTVPSDYASLASLVPSTHGFTVFTSSIPGMWTGADHIQTTWCVQLVRPIARSIFDAIDVHRPSQTKPRADRMRVFKRWYLTGMEDIAEKMLPHSDLTTVLTLDDHSNSVNHAGQRLVLRSLGRAGKPTAHVLPIPPQEIPGQRRFTFLSNVPLKENPDSGYLDVLLCSVLPVQPGHSAALFSMNLDLSDGRAGSTRLACKNAATDRIILPASYRTSTQPFHKAAPFSYLQYELEDLAEHQFVAIVDRVSETTHAWAIAEFSDSSEGILHVSTSLQRLLAFGIRLKLPAERPLVTTFEIPALHSSLLALKLSMGKQACGDTPELFTPLLRQYLSEPHESRYFVNVKEANVSLHGIAPFMPPPLRSQAASSGISLQFWTDPTCASSIDVGLQVDVAGSIGKLVMRYRTVFAAFPLLIVALVVRKQFKIYDHSGVFVTFMESMDLCLRTSLPLLFLALTFFAVSRAVLSAAAPTATSASWHVWSTNTTESAIDYTKNDLLLGSQDPIFWFLLPMCGLLSAGFCILINYAALGVISFLQAFAATSPKRRVITASVLLLLVSTVIPYQFAYLVSCIVQLATCSRATKHLRENVSGLEDRPSRETDRLTYVTNILFFILAVYAAVYGVSYAYLLHHLVNGVAAWLVALHFSSTDLLSSLLSSGLTRMILDNGEDDNNNNNSNNGDDVKKRP